MAGCKRHLDGNPNGSSGIHLAADLEALGPTFIKLGQLLSTRPSSLSPAYIQGLSKLQDKVAPFAFDKVEAIRIRVSNIESVHRF